MMGHFLENELYRGDWDSMPDYMQQMTQSYFGGNQVFWQISGLMHFITWILVMVLLIALIRWVWRKGDKIK